MSTTCPACGHENRDGRKFCAECGGPLAPPVCQLCGAANEAREKFCGDCGASLTATEKTAPASAAAGEKKHITVLFADVAGSMDLQERLDAEVWAEIMGRFVSILAEGVRRFGGTVDKFTGDGIMALFGAPVAQEDHARRACHAAWQLTRAIGEYSEELRTQNGIELHVRLGLNSGEVVVGRVGDDVTLDPTALGHTVGLAQRMETMAAPGTALLTEYTARLVEGWFELHGLGTRTVKGASAPLRVYGLGSPVSSAVRRTVGASPLVGRERELAELDDALDMACEAQFRVVGVVGEAGVGKSRLCEEFIRSAGDRGVTVHRAAGVSHGQEVPLFPVLAFQREYFGIAEADDPVVARRKVTDRLLNLDRSLEDTLPLMFDFLEVSDPARPVPALAPEVRMRRILDAVRRITARRTEREPLVLVFEDLHWFDPQSEAFLERLIESYPGSRTLVVTNFRPEFSARWMRHSYYRQLPLAPLREEGVSELLGGLLGVDLSLAPLVSFILARTGGNPFFVEEVVRGLIEDGTLAGWPGNYRLTRPLHEIRVPPSVQAVLAARIDRLPAEQKAVLEAASVIGRTFDIGVLSAVTGSGEEELDGALSALCAGELVQEAAETPTGEYRFWHPLTQEVAYGSLLADRRRGLHLAVAEALVGSDSARHDERAGVIAAHFERAAARGPAAEWHFRAGTWALRTDFQDAGRRWYRAIDQLEGLPLTDQTLTIGVWVRARLLQIGARVGISRDEADRIHTQGRALSEGLAAPDAQIALTRAYSTLRLSHGDVAGCLAGYLDLARSTEAQEDPESGAGLWAGIAVSYSLAGPVAEGLRAAGRVVELTADDPRRGVKHLGFTPLTGTRVARARLLGQGGLLKEASEELDRAVRLAREHGEGDWIAFALATYPRLAAWSGELDDALARASEAVNVAEDLGSSMMRIVALHGVGLAHLLGGRMTDAAAGLDGALGEARRLDAGRFEEAAMLAHRAQVYVAVGDEEKALQTADEAVTVARRQGAPLQECLALLTRARIRRSIAAPVDEISPDLAAATTLAQDLGAVTYDAAIHEELGWLHSDRGELREAERRYRRVGATGHARRLKAELAARISQ